MDRYFIEQYFVQVMASLSKGEKKFWLDLQVGPNRYIGLLILSDDISLLQIYQYWHMCSPISADIKTVI